MREANESPKQRWWPLLLAALLAGCNGQEQVFDPSFTDPLPTGRGSLPDLSRADHNFDSRHFSGNGVCSECHDDPNAGTDFATMYVTEDSGERDLSINKAWQTSMMANATRDPYWHAVVAYEIDNYPELEPVINETCTRCHAPMMNVMAKREGFDIQLFSKGSVEDGNYVPGIYDMNGIVDDNATEEERRQAEIFNHAMDGVSCSFCHQVDAEGLGEEETMTGRYNVVEYSEENKSQRPSYGQYENPETAYMVQNSDHTPLYGAHVSSSELCSTCHNLNVSPVDKDGNPEPGGHFAEQAPYTEWEQSNFADGGPEEASCQNCHMPKVNVDVPMAIAGGAWARPGFSEHTFLAANTVIQQIMQDNKEELGIDPTIDFSESIKRNRKFLQTSADVSILWKDLDSQSDRGEKGLLDLGVMISNNTGHKLPTAYHSRRAWLHVIVTDVNGKVIYENGKMQPDGRIVGLDEDVDTRAIEPHYDVVLEETQVQVYQSVAGNSDGERAHSLLNNSFYIKDNRLLPRGFNKFESHPDTAVAGAALEDNNFVGGEDRVRYQIPLSSNGPWNVVVELRYQPLGYGHLRDLFRKSDRIDQVDMLRTMFEAVQLKDELISRASANIPLP